MARLKGKNFEKWNYGLIISALLILILAAGFQTVKQAWFRIAGDFFFPYLDMPAQAGYALAESSSQLYSKGELAAKVKKLQKSNRVFAAKVAQFGELTVENEKLRSILKLPKRADFNYMAAEIILRDPLHWKEGFTVNRGNADGIVSGTPVLCFNPEYPDQAILAGVVKSTSKHSSQVVSVLSPRFRLSGFLAGARTHGIINGDSRKALKPDEININFLPVYKKFELEDKCYTSGFEHHIPAGFLIGVLKKMDEKQQIYSNDLYLSAKLRPAARLDRLHFVVLAVPLDVNGNTSLLK